MKRILISDVYHIVLSNKNICILAKMMHLSKHFYDLSLYYPKSFLYQKSVFLPVSPTFSLLSTKYILKVLQRRNLAAVNYKINFCITSE